MPSITLRQHRISRHVPLDALHRELVRRYRVDGSIESLGKYEANQTDSNRLWCGLRVADFKSACDALRAAYQKEGAYPTDARVPLQPAFAGGTRVPTAAEVANGGPAPREATAGAQAAQPRAAQITREDFAVFWMDETVSMSEVLNLFDLTVAAAERLARDFGLPVPKPYRERRDDMPDPALDGMTKAQQMNSAYRQASDETKINVARWLEARRVDRSKLIRLYDTHPSAVCAGWIGGIGTFYVALGIMDVPLRQGAQYSKVDYPEEFPPEPDPRRAREHPLLNDHSPAAPNRGGFVRAVEAEPAPAPEPVAVEAVRVPVITAGGGISLAGLEAARDSAVALQAEMRSARDAMVTALARMQREVEEAAAEIAALDVTVSKYETAIAAFRALEIIEDWRT